MNPPIIPSKVMRDEPKYVLDFYKPRPGQKHEFLGWEFAQHPSGYFRSEQTIAIPKSMYKGSLDYLVNNAGIHLVGLLTESDSIEVVNVNTLRGDEATKIDKKLFSDLVSLVTHAKGKKVHAYCLENPLDLSNPVVVISANPPNQKVYSISDHLKVYVRPDSILNATQ